ncbi:MAG: OmpA family protein [Rugosibacter sp.]|nr:OmpA family protein [Rugosibacter sp.]
MTYSLIKKKMGLAVSCALALSVVSGMARADTHPADTGYLIDQRGTVARSGFGLCWHTGFGPAVHTPECDSTVVPTPIATAAEPAPPAVVAPKPVAERVTLDADTLFDFDKAVLRPAGRVALDDFLGKLKGIDLEVITAVGHADRFGSEAYNQRLSEQRAAAVKTYLVSKGIEPNRIQTEGKGEMQPVTKAGECRGAKSAKVIACLQSDRRVNIEVIGSRIDR